MRLFGTAELFFDFSISAKIKEKIHEMKRLNLAPNQGAILWTRRLGEDLVKNKRVIAGVFYIDLEKAPVVVSDTQEGHEHTYRRLRLYKSARDGYYYAVETFYNSHTEEDSDQISQEGVIKLGAEKEQSITKTDPLKNVSLAELLEKQVFL